MSLDRLGIAFIEAEVALRKSIFLKGYELGKGRPLTNEDAELRNVRQPLEHADEEEL